MIVVAATDTIPADVGYLSGLEGEEGQIQLVVFTTIGAAVPVLNCNLWFHVSVRMRSRQSSFLGHCFFEVFLKLGITRQFLAGLCEAEDVSWRDSWIGSEKFF